MSGFLITGATSYLGEKLVQRLTQSGQPVHVIARPTSDTRKLAGMRTPPTIHVHDGSTEQLCEIVAGIGPISVCHLASMYRRTHEAEDVQPIMESIVTFGTQLVEAMYRAKARHLVTLGSYFQFYGSDSQSVNFYAAAKSAFDAMLDYYMDAHGLRVAHLILFDVYGEDDLRIKLMTAVRNAVRDGRAADLTATSPGMSLVHVDDVVGAIVHAVENNVEGGPFAVNADEIVTAEEVVDAFETETGLTVKRNRSAFKLPDRHPDSPWSGPRLPGWEPKIGLRDGVRRMLRAGASDET